MGQAPEKTEPPPRNARLALLNLLALYFFLGFAVGWLGFEPMGFAEAIARALDEADAMVYCISTLSLASNWTGVELPAARDRGLTVLPLLVDDYPIEELPSSLRDQHLIVPFAGHRRQPC